MDYSINKSSDNPQDPKNAPFGTYWEITRSFNFWQNTKLGGLSLQAEYNGGVYNGKRIIDNGQQTTGGNRQGAEMRDVFMFNDRLYVIARRGETFRSLGEELDISYRKLAKYNERDKHDTLQEGEIVWLEKKARKAPKEYRNRPHVVQPGESMYSISQYYGIRLKRLYKLNDLTPDYVIRVGDVLKLR